MKQYTTIQQVKILNSCTNATELLEVKETLEELQLTSPVAQLVYDRMMQHFLETNKISPVCQN